jgi:DNA-binding MarR family transcriptional regulator
VANNAVHPTSIAAIQAWTRLDQAIAGFNRTLERKYSITGAQLAILRLVDEWSRPGPTEDSGQAVALAALRERLVMHPATLGQLLERLAIRGLVQLIQDPSDRRRRLVALTTEGSCVVNGAPLAGPVRLRYFSADPDRTRRLAEALKDAITLFGLEEYQDDRSTDAAQHRSEAG